MTTVVLMLVSSTSSNSSPGRPALMPDWIVAEWREAERRGVVPTRMMLKVATGILCVLENEKVS